MIEPTFALHFRGRVAALSLSDCFSFCSLAGRVVAERSWNTLLCMMRRFGPAAVVVNLLTPYAHAQASGFT